MVCLLGESGLSPGRTRSVSVGVLGLKSGGPDLTGMARETVVSE